MRWDRPVEAGTGSSVVDGLTLIEHLFDDGAREVRTMTLTLHGTDAARPVPVPGRVRQLLARADAELVAAQFSAEPWEQFSHAHLAAVRGAAAVVAAQGAPTGRSAPRTVWGQLGSVAPALSRWAAVFADAAPLRAGVEAGRFDLVTAARAEEALVEAEDFVDVVRSFLAGESAAARAS